MCLVTDPLRYLQVTRQRMFDLLNAKQSSMIERNPDFEVLCIPSEILHDMFHITDAAASRIAARVDGPWLNRKIENSVSENRVENISGILAEIRVYDELLSVLPPGQIHSDEERQKGPDFIVDLFDREVWIEVCCPDINLFNYNFYEISHTETCRMVVQSRTDPRKNVGLKRKGSETAQGEIAKKLSEQKFPEREQSSDAEFSVLWMDFNDRTRWRRNVSLDYCMPILSSYGRITSGYFWYAFYVQEGEPIFGAIDADSSNNELAYADFNGRFERLIPADDGLVSETNIDMVIVSTSFGKSGFMNQNSLKPLSQTVYDFCLRLPNLRSEFSWLAENSLITLKDRIERCHEVLAELKESFADPDNRWRRDDIINRMLNERWL